MRWCCWMKLNGEEDGLGGTWVVKAEIGASQRMAWDKEGGWWRVRKGREWYWCNLWLARVTATDLDNRTRLSLSPFRTASLRTVRGGFQFTDWPEQGVPKSGEGASLTSSAKLHKTKEQFGQDGPSLSTAGELPVAGS